MSKYENMNSQEFNLEIIKELIEDMESKACKLENSYDDFTYEAEGIIHSCITQLKTLINQ